jgi:hypothetical protein
VRVDFGISPCPCDCLRGMLLKECHYYLSVDGGRQEHLLDGLFDLRGVLLESRTFVGFVHRFGRLWILCTDANILWL